MIPQLSQQDTDPAPTSPESRCALALSLLNHREPSLRLCELVGAVMRGVTLGELIDLEVQGE